MSRIIPARLGLAPDEERPSRPFALAVDGCPPDSLNTQQFLDALPVAAAVVVVPADEPRVLARNQLFVKLLKSGRGAHLHGIAAAVREHVGSRACTRQLLWAEPVIGGRHYAVYITRLAPHPRFGVRLLLTVVDRTAEVETERSLRFGMLHDSLTGLPNRLALEEAIDAADGAGVTADGAAGKAGEGVALLVLNLSRFSRINESIGGLAGDELIITVARRLVAAMRAGDMLARMSGDEFGILVRQVRHVEDARQVARRLQAALGNPLRLSEHEVSVDCAIGCAVRHGAGEPSSAELIRNAQVALKRAKRSRTIEFYRAGDVQQARHRFGLETDLRRAIDAGGLGLAFQPLVELDSGRLTGFEVLARWNHPERGPVSPAEFIGVAEESGLIVPLGRWVLEEALRTLGEWDRRARRTVPVYLSINVSPMQLARDAVAVAVEGSLDRHAIGGDRLTLELTESSIVADPARAKGVLEALKRLSCRVAMDDFGTGYSSLASLQRLPIDVLKVDRSFVAGMFEDRDSTSIIRAILSLASALGMTTIAEGIETEAAARTLTALGATIGQGYHFARPMPADNAFAFLTERS